MFIFRRITRILQVAGEARVERLKNEDGTEARGKSRIDGETRDGKRGAGNAGGRESRGGRVGLGHGFDIGLTRRAASRKMLTRKNVYVAERGSEAQVIEHGVK